MGDFNIDPRDPRPPDAPNPAGQPEVSPTCPDRSCSAYWLMVDAGFVDAGPDATDPQNWTWGSDGSLAGPSLGRLDDAVALGNPLGFTDRLDYVFVRGPNERLEGVARACSLAFDAPYGDVWASDHLGVLAEIGV
jgi:hypothetical protein